MTPIIEVNDGLKALRDCFTDFETSGVTLDGIEVTIILTKIETLMTWAKTAECKHSITTWNHDAYRDQLAHLDGLIAKADNVARLPERRA